MMTWRDDAHDATLLREPMPAADIASRRKVNFTLLSCDNIAEERKQITLVDTASLTCK